MDTPKRNSILSWSQQQSTDNTMKIHQNFTPKFPFHVQNFPKTLEELWQVDLRIPPRLTLPLYERKICPTRIFNKEKLENMGFSEDIKLLCSRLGFIVKVLVWKRWCGSSKTPPVYKSAMLLTCPQATTISIASIFAKALWMHCPHHMPFPKFLLSKNVSLPLESQNQQLI